MKKLLLLFLVIVSCSNDDSIDQRNFDFLNNEWTYTHGTFNGNNKSGVVDPFFDDIDLVVQYAIPEDNFFKYLFTYSNGAGGSLQIDTRPETHEPNEFHAGNFIDEGVKRFNSFTTYYDRVEMLIDSEQNEILINKDGFELYEFVVSGNSMTWTKELDVYTVTYYFIRTQ